MRQHVNPVADAFVLLGVVTEGHPGTESNLAGVRGRLSSQDPKERRLPGAKKDRLVQAPQDPNVRAAEEAMERALGTKVRVLERRGGRGHIEIEYYSLEDLNRIYYSIVKKPEIPA